MVQDQEYSKDESGFWSSITPIHIIIIGGYYRSYNIIDSMGLITISMKYTYGTNKQGNKNNYNTKNKELKKGQHQEKE